MKNKIIILTFVLLLTLVFGTIFVIGQQTIRLSANMPQIQSAQDAAQRLNDGVKPQDIVPVGSRINLTTSSAGFLIIYDRSGKVVASSAQLNGSVPIIPFGVLQHTKSPGYNAVTWQPVSGVRIASIEVKTDNYYVLAGRSLAEPEKLVETIVKLTAAGYVISLLALSAGSLLYKKVSA